MLTVIQLNTPGATSLPGTEKELLKIKSHTSGSRPEFKPLVGAQATVDSVLREIKDCSIVHFACHGVQATDPLNSRLLLHNGSLSLSQLMYISLPNAKIAFLSACQTATGEKKLPDEAVHLAAGMLAAGFKSVIGTMRSIRDDLAPEVADRVYAWLLKDGNLESGTAAEALHHAVEEIRKRNPSDLDWVPFIHMGT